MWEENSAPPDERNHNAVARGVGGVRRFVLALTLLFAVTACPATQTVPTSTSLYADLGGIEGLRPIVDELVWRLVTDDIIGRSLAKRDIATVKEQSLIFLCALTGGPCLDAGERPLIGFEGSPSAAARRTITLLHQSALIRGAKEPVARRLITQFERQIRAFIGPPRG